MTDNRRHPISEQTKTIWKLSNDGMPQREITKLLGLNRGVVSGAVNRGRKSGRCNQKVKTKETVRNSSPLTYGYIGQITGALSIEQLEWLMSEAEKVGYKTAAEYVAEIVMDAHEEAKSKENDQ
jgi:DNA-binding transcriptional regulator LsrR (DeoR family)